MIIYRKDNMPHVKAYRRLVGNQRYTKVITSLQYKIMEMGALKPAALPFINNALWDSNPPINYPSDCSDGVLDLSKGVTANFFSALAEYIKKNQ